MNIRRIAFGARRQGLAVAGIRAWILGLGVLGAAIGTGRPEEAETYTVIAYNDLGMHCMQQDFSQMMILPPFNTVRAQVIRRGGSPDIMTSDVTLTYELPGNTTSSDKCNFWTYAPALLGVNLAPDLGVAGFGMSGSMVRDAAARDFKAEGIPVTPVEDDGKENPYGMALITTKLNGSVVAQTQTVVPVSWEMSCNICHNKPGETVATNILASHDRLHATNLMANQPVLCASCHADAALGAPGTPGVSTLSSAMHSAHAPRMAAANLTNECYACHPGFRTNCQRDLHTSKGMTCNSCHTSMEAVGNPARRPWVDEPRCADCHTKAGFEFEPAGVRFRDATGHGGVKCITCHGSPHAMGPATTATDNAQTIRLQGHAGKIDTCTVCHTTIPGPFPHRAND
jgi:hypothetical protein